MRGLLIAAIVLGLASPAAADWTGKDASGAIITFSNPGTCSSVVCVPTAQLVNAQGTTLLGTAGVANPGVLTVQGIAAMTPFKVDGSGVTQPVSGTFFQATQPVSAAALPLPAGAATSANQPTNAAQGSTTSGQTGTLLQGAVTTTSPSYTNAQTSPLSLDTKGNARVVLGGGTMVTASATGTTAATTATLAATAGVTNYLCGFAIRANATAASTTNATVTGGISGTMNFTQWTAPLSAGLGLVEEIFVPCIPASAANIAISVVSGAAGSGGTVSVSAWGYRQ